MDRTKLFVATVKAIRLKIKTRSEPINVSSVGELCKKADTSFSREAFDVVSNLENQ